MEELCACADANCRADLYDIIGQGFAIITTQDCNGYWMNMLTYLRRALLKEKITD